MQKPNLLEDKPILNSDENTWGIKLNKIIDKLQSFVNGIVDNLNNKLDKGNVTNDYSSAEKIEAKIKEKVNSTDYDNLKIKVDNQSLDYTTFKQEFKDGNYVKFNTTKNLEDKTGIVKDLVIENITLNNINGEPYTKSSNISENDVKTIGDRLYEPKIEKKTGFNLDVSSLITSNSETVLASTKLVNQVISEVKQDMTTMSSRLTRDLQSKVNSTDFNSLKSKVDSIDTTTLSSQLNAKANKTDLNDVIKNLRLDNSKLKYKQFNGTIDEDMEIELPSSSGGAVGSSEFDNFLNREWWKDNGEARGYGLLGFQYKELVTGFAGSRIDGVSKPFGILKHNNSIFGAVKLTKLDLGSIIVDSITNSVKDSVYRIRLNAYHYGKEILDNFDTNKSKLTPRPKQVLDRLSGSLFSEVSRTIPLNSERMKFIANEFSKGVLMDISIYQDVILTENPIIKTPISNALAQNTLKYLAILLGVHNTTDIENNKIYVTQGNFTLNPKEQTMLYLKDIKQLKVNPINPHVNLTFDAVNEFTDGTNLPKYFYCLIYKTETELVCLPLINHFCIKKTDNPIFYEYLTKLYNGSATWGYDPQRAIINITPKKLTQDTYKTFNVTDNRVGLSEYNYTNRYQIDLDILTLTEDAQLTQKIVDRYYNNKYYGYTYLEKQKEELYVIMNLNTFDCMDKLYFTTQEYENIGDEILQQQYREEYFKKSKSENSSSFASSIIYPIQNVKVFDRVTGKIITQNLLDNPIIYPMNLQNDEYNIGVYRYIPLGDGTNSFRKVIHRSGLANFKTKFIKDILRENEQTFRLEQNKVYVCKGDFVLDEYSSSKYRFANRVGIELKSNNQDRGYMLHYGQKNPQEVVILVVPQVDNIYLFPLCDNALINNTSGLYTFFNNLLGDKEFKHIVGCLYYSNKFSQSSQEGYLVKDLGYNELLVSDSLYLNVEQVYEQKTPSQSQQEYIKYSYGLNHLGYLVKVQEGIWYIGEPAIFTSPIFSEDKLITPISTLVLNKLVENIN
nr:MAG TPA: hypothetical protein [Ackermannviridae sp.]